MIIAVFVSINDKGVSRTLFGLLASIIDRTLVRNLAVYQFIPFIGSIVFPFNVSCRRTITKEFFQCGLYLPA